MTNVDSQPSLLSRRNFLRGGVAAVAGFFLSRCAPGVVVPSQGDILPTATSMPPTGTAEGTQGAVDTSPEALLTIPEEARHMVDEAFRIMKDGPQPLADAYDSIIKLSERRQWSSGFISEGIYPQRRGDYRLVTGFHGITSDYERGEQPFMQVTIYASSLRSPGVQPGIVACLLYLEKKRFDYYLSDMPSNPNGITYNEGIWRDLNGLVDSYTRGLDAAITDAYRPLFEQGIITTPNMLDAMVRELGEFENLREPQPEGFERSMRNFTLRHLFGGGVPHYG